MYIFHTSEERDVGGEAVDGKASAVGTSGKTGAAKRTGIEDAFQQLSLQSDRGATVADSIYVEPDGKKRETNPTYSDFLVARATHPGNFTLIQFPDKFPMPFITRIPLLTLGAINNEKKFIHLQGITVP